MLVVLCCRADLLLNISNLVQPVALIKADGPIPNIVQYNLSVHLTASDYQVVEKYWISLPVKVAEINGLK